MKKNIYCFIFVLWVLTIYSCSAPEEVTFSNNGTSITGNAIYFQDSYKEAIVSTPFTIDIHIQEVTSLIGAEIEFSFDKELVDFTSASAGILLLGAEENVLIDEIDLEIGRVLLTLATAQDEGSGLSGSGSIVQLTFTPKSIGSFDLKLDLSLETGPCLWHEFSDDHSIYIEDTSPTSIKVFQSLSNATIEIQ